jgi:hypothetical protein
MTMSLTTIRVALARAALDIVDALASRAAPPACADANVPPATASASAAATAVTAPRPLIPISRQLFGEACY